MPYYEIWLKDKRGTVVKGDAIELEAYNTEGRNPGDLMVKRDGKIIALFRSDELAGYVEHETKPSRASFV
jgi:hypothetical protein